MCNQSHDERIREALDDFYSALSDKVLPVDYSKCSKISNTFLFLFSISGLEFTKILVRVANREDPDQMASGSALFV